MTVLFTLLSPAAGVSRDAFHDHWRHPHGTLGSRLSAVRSYVQNHRIRPAGLAVSDDRVEGVVRVELHHGSSAASIAEDPLYRDHLATDEARFIDLETISPYVAETISLNPIRPATERAADHDEDTDNLADHLWSPFDAASAATLLSLVAEEPTDCEDRAREIGALWHGVYRVSGNTAEGDQTRFIEQFWWPTIGRCTDALAGRRGPGLPDLAEGTRSVLASCERLL